MRVSNGLVTIVLAALILVPVAACEKSEQEADKFPRADDATFQRTFSEMVSYRMPNGISVYLQQDSTRDQVAVEIFHRAGFAQEPAGKPQVAHLAEHVVLFSPIPGYGVGEAAEVITRAGRIAAEAVGDFVHFDLLVPSADFEELVKIIGLQMTSMTFDQGLLEEHADRAASEIPKILNSPRAALTKFAMTAMLQAVQHGRTNVPLYQANFDVTTSDIAEFHSAHYIPNNLVIVVVGNVSVDRARALLDEHLAGIPRAPEPPRYSATISRDMNVTWDIDADAFFLVYPGPFEDERERAALVAFGAYLSQYIMNTPEIPSIARTTYTTNQTYPLNDLPFFVFAQANEYKSTAELRDKVVALVDEAVASLDEKMYRRVIGVFKSLVETSLLESRIDDATTENHIVISQHAVNTGVKHYLRNGLTTEEYTAILDSITFEEMKGILERYLSKDQRHVVTITRD